MGKGKRNRTLRKTKTALSKMGVKTNGIFDDEFTKLWSRDPKFRKRASEGEILEYMEEHK